MSNPRSVVSFGIGFSALAIASIGLLPIAVEQDQSGGALNVAQQRQIIAKESERLAKQRKLEKERAEALARLAQVESEQISEEETNRQYAELVARLSVVAPEELAKPVELAPDAIDKLASIISQKPKYETQAALSISDETQSALTAINDDEAMALIMILAEID